MKRLFIYLTAIMLLINTLSSAKEFHVFTKGSDTNNGLASKPFKTISQAVKYAFPGDTITVHAGTYREWVNPIRGGDSDSNRIVYRAAPGEKVEIKGSEVISGWKKEKKSIWKVVIPNSFFGNYNPYKDLINGDWFFSQGRIHHTGEVFLNGKSLYEAAKIENVFNPVANTKIADAGGSTYTWYCESDEFFTTIWANFHSFNPNKELVEISTRKTCFYPETEYINYITISGFHISQAATQWGAPTAEQVGMVATHWNKGWIIENNVISDSKCSGITLGKERETGHNVWSADESNVNRDGNIHYIEVIFRVLRNNWDKEHIGSHIVRNNRIFNCEQTGICGSMGASYSTIENNHIYNIWTKRQFDGAEIGGIKFHAAIDATIRKNRINNCGRGLWLDWMTQGVRVSQNLFYNHDKQDIWLEVNHGPCIVDNNILLSPTAVSNQSQGGAFIHNLIMGLTNPGEDGRFTPYFLPHSTLMAGLTTIYGGDDRIYNNIFIKPANDKRDNFGTIKYNKMKLPVWISGNLYYNGATPYEKETNFLVSETYDPQIQIEEKGENVVLNFNFNNSIMELKNSIISTSMLGKAKIPKAAFENPDGTPITFDEDYFGNKRTTENTFPGPFAIPNAGKTSVKVW